MTAAQKSPRAHPASVQIGDRLPGGRPNAERDRHGLARRPRQGAQQRTRLAPCPACACAGRERACHPEKNGSRPVRRPGRNQPNEKKNSPVHGAPPCVPRHQDQERFTGPMDPASACDRVPGAARRAHLLGARPEGVPRPASSSRGPSGALPQSATPADPPPPEQRLRGAPRRAGSSETPSNHPVRWRERVETASPPEGRG